MPLKAPRCCSCNSSGRCLNCSCVKGKRRCKNCVPNLHKRCGNIALPGELTRVVNECVSQHVLDGGPRHSRAPNSSASLDSSSSSSLSFPSSSSCPPLFGNPSAADNEQHQVQCHDIPPAEAASGGVNDPAIDAVIAADANFGNWSVPLQLQAQSRVPDLTVRPSGGVEPASSSDRGDGFYDLPAFTPLSSPDFSWDELPGHDLVQSVTAAYAEVVHWRRNIFSVPSGQAGKDFVRELSRLIRGYAERSAIECIALKAAMFLPQLLLQKPHLGSKAKDHVTCLERRMRLWKQGDIDSLIREGRTLQHHLRLNRTSTQDGRLAHNFAKLMLMGKVKAAIRLISEEGKGSLLSLDEVVPGTDGSTVREVLKVKHPSAQQIVPEAIIQPNQTSPDSVHPILFESIDGPAIRAAALRTNGSAGPSGLDSSAWRRLCVSFHGASNDLCTSVALLARRLSTDLIDPTGLCAYTACRLIPLDKRPGVRPIGVGEVLRRIVGKAVLVVVGPDVQSAAGSLQLCAGQTCGIEAAVHAMRDIFQQDSSEAVLLVDAKNAFNTLNRQVALRNISVLCPAISRILINTYREPVSLFVDGEVMLADEGTTQGDPLAMAMYALATVPLINATATPETNQVWFADDATSGGRLKTLRQWWDLLCEHGPDYGYNVNPPKSWLIVKPSLVSSAVEVFSGTGVQITAAGQRHLGGVLGVPAFVESYINERVERWIFEIEQLTSIAASEPHAAYSAYTHGLASRWTYFARIVPSVAPHFQPLEKVICEKFIPALTGRPALNAEERALLALPARLGGLGLINPCTLSGEHELSKKVSAPLVALIVQQQIEPGHTSAQQLEAKRIGHQEKRRSQLETANDLKSRLPPTLRLATDLASEKGASTWLTSLPLEEHGFALHKSAFRDALCLRYGWQPQRLPSHCTCGSNFSVEHALSCNSGGFPLIRHNELRDISASLLSEVCNQVSTEPTLQPLSGEALRGPANVADDARSDISACGFWGGRFERTFFDVRVFNPFVRSNQTAQIATAYRRHEQQKRNQYERRIREVDHSSFTPLVWSTSGGAGPSASVFLKRLASLLADKKDQPYSVTMGWLRCRFGFALLRSSIMCLRGARSRKSQPIFGHSHPVLARAEGHFRL